MSTIRDSRCMYRTEPTTLQCIHLAQSRLNRLVDIFNNSSTHMGILDLVMGNPRDPAKLSSKPLEALIVVSHGNAEAKMAMHTLQWNQRAEHYEQNVYIADITMYMILFLAREI